MIKLDSPTKVRILRERRRMSQQDLATLAGLSRQTIIRMETSPVWWLRLDHKSLKSLSKVADVLGVDQDYILQEEGDEEMPQQKGSPAAATAGPEAPKAGATVVDLSTLLAAISTGGQGPLDVTLPITDRGRLPKPAHATEQWDDQARCFLEAMRSTYMDWLDQDGADAGTLIDAVSDAIEAWADRHGYQLSEDDDEGPREFGFYPAAKLELATEDGELDTYMFGGAKTVKAGDLVGPLKTVRARVEAGDGLVYDVIKDRKGKLVRHECVHDDTESMAPADHPYTLLREGEK